MAADKKGDKNKKKKDGSKSLWKRFKKFFSDIKAELKRVTWPDKKRLKSNTGIVLVIVVISLVMIFIFDTAITSIFNATGFYDYKSKSNTETTETITESQAEETNNENATESSVADITETE